MPLSTYLLNASVRSSYLCVSVLQHCCISTWMGDCLWMGKPSRYVTSHLGQRSLPSFWGR